MLEYQSRPQYRELWQERLKVATLSLRRGGAHLFSDASSSPQYRSNEVGSTENQCRYQNFWSGGKKSLQMSVKPQRCGTSPEQDSGFKNLVSRNSDGQSNILLFTLSQWHKPAGNPATRWVTAGSGGLEFCYGFCLSKTGEKSHELYLQLDRYL